MKGKKRKVFKKYGNCWHGKCISTFLTFKKDFFFLNAALKLNSMLLKKANALK